MSEDLYNTGIMVGRQEGARKYHRKRRRRAMTAAGILLALTWWVLGFTIGHATAATKHCNLTVPTVHVQLDGTGTETGHVRGSCNFRWHSTNRVQLEAAYEPGTFIPMRWHTLGTHQLAGGLAGEYVVQPKLRDPYTGCGDWRYLVLVRDRSGSVIFRLAGAERSFCA